MCSLTEIGTPCRGAHRVPAAHRVLGRLGGEPGPVGVDVTEGPEHRIVLLDPAQDVVQDLDR